MAKVRVLASALALAPPLLLTVATGAQASSAPSSAPAPARPAGTVSAAAVTKTVKLVTQKQSKSYYCAPAAGRAVVSTWMPKKSLPSQKTMAKYMHTKSPNGTGNAWVPIGVNTAIHRGSYYQDLHPTSAGFVWNAVSYDIGTKKHAVIARVLAGSKPWTPHWNDKTGHVMVIYGYHSDSHGKQLYWWDPADNSFHHSSLSSSWTAISKAGKHLFGFYPS
ncbi:C39 family peptidase [Actinoallomurus spadix]|uniref:Peptidase C39-like domain-containing protein n=1 Tax=Actinoallomurus spadix TaxID=79912 RepID=A0ABN0W7E3_9ACTN|nr:C39 family peptidase [Actinoallomurus spadix]MCO5990694.1 C39 family peptidase [Actinoallomurus spadix]